MDSRAKSRSRWKAGGAHHREFASTTGSAEAAAPLARLPCYRPRIEHDDCRCRSTTSTCECLVQLSDFLDNEGQVTCQASAIGIVMSRPRRRIFGPLFYSSLIVTVLVGGYSVVLRLGSMISEWHEVRSLVQMLRAENPRTREMAATLLERQGAEISTPLLLDAARDMRGEVRAVACRSLAVGSVDPSVVVPVLAAAAGDDQEEVRHAAAHSLGR